MLNCPRPRKEERGIWKCRASVRPSVRPRYAVSALIFVDLLISNLRTSIILGISSLSSKLGKIRKKLWEWWQFLRCLSKHIKIFRCFNLNENRYLEDVRPDECDSDECDLNMAAIAATMISFWQLFSKWSLKHIKHLLQCSNYNDNWYLGVFRGCDRDQYDFKIAVISAAIFKMAAKMRKISKCSNFNENTIDHDKWTN